MSQCTHCQADLPANAQFCSSCGTPVEEDQNQSADGASIDAESREDTSLAQADQSQPAEAANSNVVAEEDVPLAEEQHPSEDVQHSGSVIAEQGADEADQGTSPVNEPEIAAETPTSPAEDAPTPEQHSSTAAPEADETPTSPAEDAPAIEQQTASDESDLNVDQAQTMQSEDMLPEPQLASTRNGNGKARVLIAIIVVLVVLAGGAGAFTLIRQHTPAGATSQCTGCTSTTPGGNRANATRLAFSGTVSGPMTVSAQPRCQSTSMESLRTLTITFSGEVNGQLYNFGFAIDHYHGPGTYSDTPPSLTILFDTPGEATNNGWGNTSPTDTGSITVGPGEQTGNITYQLSGFGTQAGTQIQVSGNWACG